MHPDGLSNNLEKQQVVEELRGDEGMCQALLEIMEPEINRIVEEATEKSRREAEQSKKEAEKSRQEVEGIRKEAKKEAIQTAKKMLKSGKFSVEETRECVPRLSVEEIRAIAKELGQILKEKTVDMCQATVLFAYGKYRLRGCLRK